MGGDISYITSDGAAETSVTIYPDNLALITEVRRVNIPKGRSVIAFDGVSDLIIPQSLVLREFTGVMLERNFDYDLLGKTSLFENSIGETMRLTRIDPHSGAVKVSQAEIVSARRDTGVLMNIDGKIEALQCSGLGARTQFEGLPSGLTGKPVMSVQVFSETASEQVLVISYLTSGLGWRADYRVDMTSKKTASMLGWLTLTNGTAKDYKNVPLAIIAGDLNRRPETRAVTPPKPYLRAQCYPKGSTKIGVRRPYADNAVPKTPMSRGNAYFGAMAPRDLMEMADEVIVTGSRREATQEEIGDYKLYRVPSLTDLAPYQTKQIAFLNADNVDIKPYFKVEIVALNNSTHWLPTKTSYDIDNSRDGKLAKPLPKGTLRFFQKQDNGRMVYLGEDRIENLPIDEDAKLFTGMSHNVMARARVGSHEEKGKYTTYFYEFEFSNATEEAQNIELVFNKGNIRKNHISDQSHPYVKGEIDPTWRFELPSEGRQKLSFYVTDKR